MAYLTMRQKGRDKAWWWGSPAALASGTGPLSAGGSVAGGLVIGCLSGWSGPSALRPAGPDPPQQALPADPEPPESPSYLPSRPGPSCLYRGPQEAHSLFLTTPQSLPCLNTLSCRLAYGSQKVSFFLESSSGNKSFALGVPSIYSNTSQAIKVLLFGSSLPSPHPHQDSLTCLLHPITPLIKQ